MKPHIKPTRSAQGERMWHARIGMSNAIDRTPQAALKRLYYFTLANYGRHQLWPAAMVHSMVKSYA